MAEGGRGSGLDGLDGLDGWASADVPRISAFVWGCVPGSRNTGPRLSEMELFLCSCFPGTATAQGRGGPGATGSTAQVKAGGAEDRAAPTRGTENKAPSSGLGSPSDMGAGPVRSGAPRSSEGKRSGEALASGAWVGVGRGLPGRGLVVPGGADAGGGGRGQACPGVRP